VFVIIICLDFFHLCSPVVYTLKKGEKMAEMKFEEALKKLEKIVGDLERGELSLDSSLKKYEEGVKLAAICTSKLEEAEKKIEILVQSATGKKEKKPFDISKVEEEATVEGKVENPGSKERGLLF